MFCETAIFIGKSIVNDMAGNIKEYTWVFYRPVQLPKIVVSLVLLW